MVWQAWKSELHMICIVNCVSWYNLLNWGRKNLMNWLKWSWLVWVKVVKYMNPMDFSPGVEVSRKCHPVAFIKLPFHFQWILTNWEDFKYNINGTQWLYIRCGLYRSCEEGGDHILVSDILRDDRRRRGFHLGIRYRPNTSNIVSDSLKLLRKFKRISSAYLVKFNV